MRTWGDLGSWDKTMVECGKDRARLQIQVNLQLAVPHVSLTFPSMPMMVLHDDL